MTGRTVIMKKLLHIAGLVLCVFFAANSAYADDVKIPDRILGKVDAPITVEEYVSLTCSHCAEFYNDMLPELEKNYVDTGKVRFILRDFPLDGIALKAALLARCMPEDEYYPFIKILYKNQSSWAFGSQSEKTLMQYAKLGGLPEDKAKICLQDTKMQDAIIAIRTEATEKRNVEATPTFVINNGAETIEGAKSVSSFASVFDRLLAAKH
jgi:protein-disulfide isomerase